MDEVTGHCSENPLPGTLPTPKKGTEAPFRTYQAFMWALYKYFMSFKEELMEVEKCIINKGKLKVYFKAQYFINHLHSNITVICFL